MNRAERRARKKGGTPKVDQARRQPVAKPATAHAPRLWSNRRGG